ncbi:MAG TPA: hypothetical protein VK662_03310 [Acidothermaceae bacterium]|nr:hypothetical protein [Acidothermaceae bacterium]
MSLRDVLRTLVRRWYLVLPALIIAVTVAFEVFLVVPPTYRVQARLLLLPSAASSGPVAGAGNPYLSLSAGLGQTAQVIALAVTDPKSVAALSKLGADASFNIGIDAAAAAPILVATASSVNAANAEKTLSLVVQQVRAQLQNAQAAAGAPKNTFISLSVLTQSAKPSKVTKTQLRDGLAAGIGALVVLLIPIFLFERASLARRARRKAAKAANAESAAAATATVATATDAAAAHDESLRAELEGGAEHDSDAERDADSAVDADVTDADADEDDDAHDTEQDADATLNADLKDEDGSDDAADDDESGKNDDESGKNEDDDEDDAVTKAELVASDADADADADADDDDDDESSDAGGDDDAANGAGHNDRDRDRNSDRRDANKKPVGSLRVVAS